MNRFRTSAAVLSATALWVSAGLCTLVPGLADHCVVAAHDCCRELFRPAEAAPAVTDCGRCCRRSPLTDAAAAETTSPVERETPFCLCVGHESPTVPPEAGPRFEPVRPPVRLLVIVAVPAETSTPVAGRPASAVPSTARLAGLCRWLC